MKMKPDDESVVVLKKWFSDYVKTFKKSDKEFQQNIDLKEDHTMRVCQEILKLGTRLGLNEDEIRLAGITALLHDIGRFEQFAKYRTFSDSHSENHAELGIKILERYGVLNQFDDSTKEIIVCSIKYHNQPSLPLDETEKCLFFSKLLRDADKLDILRVVTTNYQRTDGQRNAALELDLPDTTEISDKVYQDLMNKRIVDITNIRTLNDLKLLQAGWIFDINFSPTLRSIRHRHYMEMIRAVLPESNKITEIFDVIDSVLSVDAG